LWATNPGCLIGLRPPNGMKARGLVLVSIHLFARRDDFVGRVGNLRPIVNRPSGITYNASNSLRLAAMWGRSVTCGRLAIGLSRHPTYFQQVVLGFRQPAFSGPLHLRKRRSRRDRLPLMGTRSNCAETAFPLPYHLSLRPEFRAPPTRTRQVTALGSGDTRKSNSLTLAPAGAARCNQYFQSCAWRQGAI